MTSGNNKQTRWFSRDADALRADLVRYALDNFSDKIVDFSPASIGGLLLELAAQVGDNFQYYVDYVFAESQWDTATETTNIERFLRDVGIIPSAASPSSGEVDFSITVPADPAFEGSRPLRSSLPVIKAGTTLRSASGVSFVLVDSIDFSVEDPNGDLIAEVIDARIGRNGTIESYRLKATGIVVSGFQNTQQVTLGSPTPFRTVTLDRSNIHEIVSVLDAQGSRWHEVDNLSQDTAYVRVRNLSSDRRQVPTLLRSVTTNRRFVREFSLTTGLTSLRFGGGTDTETTDNEDFSVPFRTSTVVPLSLDAGRIGRGRSLGEAPGNTDLFITYRYGGGVSHNVAANAIQVIDEIEVDFPGNINSNTIEEVVQSLSVNNPLPTSGGADPLTVSEWRSFIPLARVAQGRVVSQSDLVARTLALPGEFGRVFKASSRPSLPGLPTRLWVVCKDRRRLIAAPRSLKENLKVYLSEFRLIGDAVDVLDCPILNWSIRARVRAGVGVSKKALTSDIGKELRSYIQRLNLNPDQSLDLDRLRNRILSVSGVDEIVNFEVSPRVGRIGSIEYSPYFWRNDKRNGKLAPPEGGIFEMLDLSQDISLSVD